jgi:integrase
VEITAQDLKAFAKRLAEEGRAPATIRNAFAPVRALLATAVEEGLIRHNPAAGLRLPGTVRGKVKHLEPEELGRLFAETPERWRLWIHLLSYTGCRISEFLVLRWEDVDLEAGTLSVSRRIYRGELGPPKSEHGVRTIPLTRELVHELRRHRLASRYSAEGDLIFATRNGLPLHPSNHSRRIFKPAAERAGVGWASYHTLRHTCGTLLARRGLRAEEIQGWLGHHAASFTQDVYIGRPKALPDPNALGLDALAGGVG